MTTGRQERSEPTPVTVLWENILMLPIVGIVDSKRAQDIMESMLNKIQETQARVVILDILGVAMVDSKVASHLIKITQSCSLMGADCIISGISPVIAQTLVQLGIELGGVTTTATLKGAIALAFDMTGFEVAAKKKAATK
jgi:rsbT co-antagonist protein RsbR